MKQFQRHIGIDYSGAETPDPSCKGLRGHIAEGLREELDRDTETFSPVIGLIPQRNFPEGSARFYALSTGVYNCSADYTLEVLDARSYHSNQSHARFR